MTQNTTKNDKREQCDTKNNALKLYLAEENSSGSYSSSPRPSKCVFLVCWRWGRYIVLDQQGDICKLVIG